MFRRAYEANVLTFLFIKNKKLLSVRIFVLINSSKHYGFLIKLIRKDEIIGMNKFEEGFMAGFLMNYSKKETEDEKWQYPSDWLPLPEVRENEAAFLVFSATDVMIYKTRTDPGSVTDELAPNQNCIIRFSVAFEEPIYSSSSASDKELLANFSITGLGTGEIIKRTQKTCYVEGNIRTGTPLTDTVDMHMIKIQVPSGYHIRSIEVYMYSEYGSYSYQKGFATIIAYNINSNILDIQKANSLSRNRFGNYVIYAKLTGDSDFFDNSTYFFYNNYTLQKVEFETPPSNIGDYTFYNCYSINEINLPDLSRVTKIGASSFHNCYSIKKINIPNAISISTGAFSNNTSLQEVNIDNVTNISADNFNNCYALSKLSAPSLQSIEKNCFNYTRIIELDLPSVKNIKDDCFQYCYGTKIVSLPVLEELGHTCFIRCYNITNIYAPLLATCGKSGFAYCYSLKTIDLSSLKAVYNNTPVIGTSCFALQNIKIPYGFIDQPIGAPTSIFRNSFMIRKYRQGWGI